MPNRGTVASKRSYRPLLVTTLVPRADRLDDKLLSTTFQVLLWGYTLVAVLSSYTEPVKKFDDVIPLVGGMLVEQGRTPNLDFYSFYPPLGLYVNAGMFHVLGRSVMAVRLFASVLYVLVLILAMRFFQLRFPHCRLLNPLSLLLITEGILSVFVLPAWPGFAVSCAAFLTYLCSLHLRRNRLTVVAISGILTGLALLYRVNFGGYVAMVVLLDLALDWWLNRKDSSIRPGFGRDLATGLVFVGSAAICCLALLFSIYGKQAGTAVFQFVVTAQRLMSARGFVDLLEFPATPYMILIPPAWFLFRVLKGTSVIPGKAIFPAAVATIPLGIFHFGHSHVQTALILTGFELAAVVLLHVFVRRLERSELCILLFFCGLLHYFLSRTDWFHWRVLPLGLALLIPFLVLPQRDPKDPTGEPALAKGTALAVLLTAFVAGLLMRDLRPAARQVPVGVRLVASVLGHPHTMDTTRVLSIEPSSAAWHSVYSNSDEARALRYLRAQTSSTDAIFVGDPDHSRIFCNNLRLYWLQTGPSGYGPFSLKPERLPKPTYNARSFPT